jgi:putative hydrolase of the HAD superfamily
MSNNKMIKAIFFDLGGVLVTNLFHELEEALAKELGVSLDEMKAVRRKHWSRYKVGEMEGHDFWKNILDDLGSDMDADALYDRVFTGINVKEDTVAVLERLKQTNRYKLGVVSNNSNEWSDYSEKKLGLGKYFDVWISSSYVHMKKPDKEIFLLAAERIGIEPADCVFIDDDHDNSEAAAAAGMKAIRFRDAAQLEQDLRKLGIDI